MPSVIKSAFLLTDGIAYKTVHHYLGLFYDGRFWEKCCTDRCDKIMASFATAMPESWVLCHSDALGIEA